MTPTPFKYEPTEDAMEREAELRSQIPASAAGTWELAGRFKAAELASFYRYDEANSAWWQWTCDNHWRMLTGKSHALQDDIQRDSYSFAVQLQAAGHLKVAKAWVIEDKRRTNITAQDSALWSEMRRCLARPTPAPPAGQLAVPSGVVNLADGTIEPHDPNKHDTRGVTRGDYRPDDLEYLSCVLRTRLGVSVSPEGVDAFMDMAALAASGRAQSFRPLLWLCGVSGGGKGSAAKLLTQAFGGRGATAELRILERESRSDIDADIANLLEIQPLVIAVDELRGQVSARRINALSGNSARTARKPHAASITGTLPSLFVFTCTNPPALPVNEGIARRSSVVKFRKRVEDLLSADKVTDDFSQDLLDAVITCAISRAAFVGQPGYQAPTGEADALESLLRDADPINAWLEDLADDWAGTQIGKVMEAYNRAAAANGHHSANPQRFGRAANASPRWCSVKVGGNNYKTLELK